MSSIGRTLTKDELEAHLREQLRFLEASAASFDGGFEGEAKRLAVTLRVLLHDTKYSKSLLGQLGLIDRKFHDTAPDYNPQNMMTHGGLVSIALGPSSTRYVAMLDNLPGPWKEVDFDKWWNKPVFVDTHHHQLSRKELIMVAANQDGGAHVDPELDVTYAALSKDNALGWIVHDGKGEKPMEGPERAAIRQIAHETLKTMIPDYAKKPQHQATMLFGNVSLVQVAPAQPLKAQPIERVKKVGRNKACPCGSGKKYKHCHGR
jgi:hypothetical protein